MKTIQLKWPRNPNDRNAEWWAMRRMLDGLEIADFSLSEWYKIDDTTASKAFDVIISKLTAMAKAGYIPPPILATHGDTKEWWIEFSDESIDEWLEGRKNQ